MNGPNLGLDGPKLGPLAFGLRGHGSKATTHSQKGTHMSEQFTSCPQCASSDITTYSFQVACGGCDWSVPDSDPRFIAHAEALGWANVPADQPIIDAIDLLPRDFGASMTTSRAALPKGHPVHGHASDAMTAAEFRMSRERWGLSAEWLADRLGVALKTVQRWENGHRPIPEGVAREMDMTTTAMELGAADSVAEFLLTAEDPVLMIPRTGTLFGFPASWYRALVDQVRKNLITFHGEEGMAAAGFRVVYRDEVQDPS